MINNKILKLKNDSSVINYTNLLQLNISRMSSHSINVKSSVCLIYTIVMSVLIATKKMNKYWWLTIAIVVIGSFIDACYLGLEKIYVNKYNSFINKLNKEVLDVTSIYDMRPRNTKLKQEFMAMVFSSLLSFSIYMYYLPFLIISVFIKFM